jgi:hypothetical protein
MRNLFVVDRTVFKRNRSGTVSAHISINFSGEMFPTSGWNDFAVVIITAAIQSLLRLAKGESVDEQVHFMEGPFVLQLTLLDSATVRMRGIKESSRRVVQNEQVITLIELAFDLCHAAENLLAWCSSENWTSTDEKRLESCLSELKHEVLNKLQ